MPRKKGSPRGSVASTKDGGPPARRPAGGAPFWIALFLMIGALAGQVRLTVSRLGASRALDQVELRSKAALSAGRSSRTLFAENLQLLRRAARLDPLEAGIPIARGAQHLLLGSAEAAEEAYIEALRLEPRPEIYLNLGRAQLLAGTPDAARKSFSTATTLDSHLAPYVPPAGR